MKTPQFHRALRTVGLLATTALVFVGAASHAAKAEDAREYLRGLVRQYDELRAARPDINAQNLQIVRDVMGSASAERRQEAIWDDTRYGMGDMADRARGGLAAGFGSIGGEHGNPFMTNGFMSPGQVHDLGKQITTSLRPCHPDVGVASLIWCSGSNSFPSGHTAKATGAMTLAAYMFPERYQAWMNRAQEYGESRLVVGVHYPLDVMASRAMTYKATADLFAAQADDPESWLNRALLGERRWQDFNAGPDRSIADLARSARSVFSTEIEEDYRRNRAYYNYTKNYGFPIINPTDVAMVVPENARYLIKTRYPYLSDAQLDEILRTTASPSGAVFDDPWSRLHLFDAAEGYGSFASDLTVTMDAAQAADDLKPGAGFHAADRWRNDIEGPGHLTKDGTGVLTLAGANSFGGFTLANGGLILTGSNVLTNASSVSGGRLVVDGGSLASVGDFATAAGTVLQLRSASLGANGNLNLAGAVELAGSAVIETAANRTNVISGTVSGAGGLVKSGEGSLALGASNGFLGGVHVKAGTLELRSSVAAGTGDIRLNDSTTLAYADGIDVANRLLLDGAAFLNVANGRAVQSGAIGGAGTFQITGAGTLDITGDLSGFDGRTVIDGSTVVANRAMGGTVAVGAGGAFVANGPTTATVTVGAGGALRGSGSVGTSTIGSGGTLAPGNSPGTLRVLGDLTLARGSIYEVEIEPATGRADLVDVSGRARIEGGTVRHVGANGAYSPFSSYRILVAGGGVEGRFDAVTSDYLFLTPDLNYGANSVELTLLRNDVAFGSVAVTRDQASVAGALDAAGSQAVAYRQLVALDASQARSAFDQLSGDIHSSIAASFLEGSLLLRDAVGERLRLRGDGRSVAIIAQAYGPEGKSGAAVDVRAPTVGWGQVFGRFASRSGDTAEIDASTGGFVVGLDREVGAVSRLGLMGGYAYSDFDADNRGASAESSDYHLGLYGSSELDGLNLSGGTSYTWHSVDGLRQVSIPGAVIDRLSSDYSAGTAHVFGEVSRTFEFGAAELEPFLGLAYVSTRIDGFGETGGATALSFADQTVDATFGTLGLRAERTLAVGEGEVVLNGTIGWQHAFDGSGAELTRSLASGPAFAIQGAPIAQDSALVGLGVDYAIAPQTTLGVSYDGSFGKDSQSNGFKGRFTIGF